jgi:hypothetical protein
MRKNLRNVPQSKQVASGRKVLGSAVAKSKEAESRNQGEPAEKLLNTGCRNEDIGTSMKIGTTRIPGLESTRDM